jgi:hypothetical protein
MWRRCRRLYRTALSFIAKMNRSFHFISLTTVAVDDDQYQVKVHQKKPSRVGFYFNKIIIK